MSKIYYFSWETLIIKQSAMSQMEDPAQLFLQPKPFLSKDNICSVRSPSAKSVPKKVKVFINEKTAKRLNSSSRRVEFKEQTPFTLKLIKIVDSPTFRDSEKSPHFPEVTPEPVENPEDKKLPLFYQKLVEVVAVDRQLICYKNILGNRNSRIREKQQNTLKELKKVIDPELLEVTFDEFDPFAKSSSAPDFVPSAMQFIEVLDKSEALASKLLNNCSSEQIQSIFNSLDFNRKGHFDIYDLVRQVSIVTSEPYKPRDLYLTLKRLSKGNLKATLEDLKEFKICN